MSPLGPEKALIFRVTHVKNVPWILDHGLLCRNDASVDPDFINIGLQELIDKRSGHPVPVPPGGTLADYVPFYFTPWSIMMFNIKTGHGSVIKRPNTEIAVFVSSLHRLKELAVPILFTNGHAYMAGTDYFNDLASLNEVDWPLLQSRNFKRDPEHPERFMRYQAEALVHRHVPLEALLGLVCYDSTTSAALTAEVTRRNLKLPVHLLPQWYF